MQSTDANEVEVSFIIPCLNEERSLGHVLQEIRTSFGHRSCTFEILVADNGSTDRSVEVARDNAALVVQVPERGYGSALLGGIAAARGTYAVMGDADGSYVFGDAWPMIEQLQRGADLVVGNRFRGGIAPGAMPWLNRYIGNPILSGVGRIMFRAPIGDFHCGLRAFRLESVRSLKLTSQGMEFASEMIVAAQKRGLRIKEVPVRLQPDLRSRPPHLRPWSDGWRHLKYLFAESPSWAFLIPAAIAGVLSLFIGLAAWLGPLSAGSVEFSYRTASVAAVVALVSVTATWSFLVARLLLHESVPTLARRPALIGIMSVFASLAGLVILTAQFISWREAGFGMQSVGRDLLISIGGGLLLGIGGVSFFFSMILGLLRVRR